MENLNRRGRNGGGCETDILVSHIVNYAADL